MVTVIERILEHIANALEWLSLSWGCRDPFHKQMLDVVAEKDVSKWVTIVDNLSV